MSPHSNLRQLKSKFINMRGIPVTITAKNHDNFEPKPAHQNDSASSQELLPHKKVVRNDGRKGSKKMPVKRI